MLSIIIPTLDEEHVIAATHQALTRLEGSVELIYVDGGSRDSTLRILREQGAHIIKSQQGRGLQMHAGTLVATGAVFWFLHADSVPPLDGPEQIANALRDTQVVGGNFSVRFDGERLAARFLTWLYPQLGKLGLCYGDSGIFVRRKAYESAGGFKPFPIFEDLDLVQRLRRLGSVVNIPAIVLTSSRRFETHNFALTFLRWSILQLLYWLGVSPTRLARKYQPVRVPQKNQ